MHLIVFKKNIKWVPFEQSNLEPILQKSTSIGTCDNLTGPLKILSY